MNKLSTVFFVNPMGYGTLAKYDKNLLDEIQNLTVYYLGHKKNPYQLSSHNFHPIFNYGENSSFLKGLSYLRSNFILLWYIFKLKPQVIHYQWFKVYWLDYFMVSLIKKFGIKEK